MPRINESTGVTVSLGWAIGIVTLLMSIASAAGVLLYQVSALQHEVETMRTEQTKNRESIIALTATLQAQGTIK